MERLLKADEVAELLNIKPQTVYLLKSQKKIPFIQIGGSVRFQQSEIEKWVESNKSK